MRLQLLSGTYSAKSIIASAQRAVNLYPEINPPETQAPVPVTHYQRAGLTLLKSPPVAGTARCAYRSTTNELYYVVGSNVYFVNQNLSFTNIGSIGAATTPVSMVDNGTDIILVDGSTSGYTINLASKAFAKITDDGFYGSPAVQMVDGYFIFAKPGTDIMYISLNQSTSFDPTDFAAKNGYPDHLSSIAVMHREIWLIGELTTEVWYDTGASDFTFGPIPGCFIEQGCVATYSIAKQDLSVYWLSQDLQGKLMVLEGNGYKAARISNHAMEAQIQSYATYSDAIGMSYQYEGHTFYHLTFPAADKTWVYDVSTRQWHEETWTDDDGNEHRHRANCAANVYGKNIVGDWETGDLYELDVGNYTDYGDPIVFRRGFPHILADDKRMFHRQFIADMAVGNAPGLLSSNPPTVSLRWSDTRGASWGNPIQTSMGSTGQYLVSMQFQRLGMARDRVYELFWSAPYKTALNGAWLDVKAGAT